VNASVSTLSRLGDITVVVVSYNSAAVLAECLDSVPQGPALVVVDNASTDGSATLAAGLGREVRVIRSAENLGFGRGANLGFAAASTRYGLLLNADARCQPGMLEALLAAAARYPEAGLLAPAVHLPDGRLEFGHRTPFEPRHRRASPMPEGDCCCLSYVGGSAMFVPLAAFQAIGGFDPDIFLYHEDDDFCLRMRQAGRTLVHVHAARLTHIGGHSTASSPRLDSSKDWHMGWSRQHLIRKHRGMAAAVWDAVVQLGALGTRLAFRWGDPRRRRWMARAAGILDFIRGRRATTMGLR
jgi:N-acetylglucosaminyl-diphospho-decaprenol L-rhamnosyltransferase